MAENKYAIEGGITRNELEDLSISPPSIEDGFVAYRYGQKEARQRERSVSPPPDGFGKIRYVQKEGRKRERRPSLLDYFTQDGGSLVSMLGGTPPKSGRSTGRRNSIGGTISFDQFGDIDFDDFQEESSRPTPESLVAPLTNPAFETLDDNDFNDIDINDNDMNDINSTGHSDALNINQASSSIGDSIIQAKDDVYADESLDHFQYALTPPKHGTGRKNSMIMDTVTSLNINALQFGNEDVNSRKRKISGITNPTLASDDINIAQHEYVDEHSTKPSIHSLLFEGTTKSLELSNAQVYSNINHNELVDAGDKQLVRQTSLPVVSQSSIEHIKAETSNVGPVIERKISTSIMNFFSMKENQLEVSGDKQLVRHSSFPVVSQSATEPTMGEASNTAPLMERKISTSMMNFFTGVLDKAVAGSTVERAQEVKEIAETGMMFR